LKAQLEAWDKVVEKKSAENPYFKKVMDSQRAFAGRACQWQNDYMVDFKMAYNRYFSQPAKKA
jgi:TRAP-type mannitol/chloroaromatic compound transport system substrate-binding protein